MSNLPSIGIDTNPPSVVDPLAWLERDGPDVQAWLVEQRQRTCATLAALPGRLDAVRDATKEARRHAWRRVPLGRGGRWFFHARPEGAERVAIHIADSLLDPGRPLLTPERFDDARGLASIGAIYPSPDGRHLIASVLRGDRDATELVLVAVDDCAILDRIDKPTAAFAVWHDDTSFFWSHGTTLALRRLDGGETSVLFPIDGDRLVPTACRGLERAGHTSRGRLCLYGIGAGGLLVLGSVVMEPDLCMGVVADNPIADMAGFSRWGNGAYWVREFGDPAADLAAIARWSPLHNLKAGTDYPPVLIVAATDGDGITPIHGRKMAAALQATGAKGPFLLWDEGASGPQGAATLTGQSLEWAVIQHFAAGAVGLALTPPVRAV